MEVRVEGDFLGAEPWEVEGHRGFSVSILQGTASAKLSIKDGEQPKTWPARMTPVVIEGIVRAGYEGRGFKVQVLSFSEKAASKV